MNTLNDLLSVWAIIHVGGCKKCRLYRTPKQPTDGFKIT